LSAKLNTTFLGNLRSVKYCIHELRQEALKCFNANDRSATLTNDILMQ